MFSLKTVIAHVSRPADGRLIAVSDIHGQKRWLEGLLDSLSFGERDRLLIAGDLSERGRENLETLRLVMRLCREGRAVASLGNVEYKQLSLLSDDSPDGDRRLARLSRFMKADWGHSLFDDMAREAGFDLDRGERGCVALFRARFKEEIDFLAGLPALIDLDDFLFVHGGVPTDDVSALAGTDALPYLKNDDFLNHAPRFDRWVVTGHWPVVNYRPNRPDYNPLVDRERHVIAMDGGCGLKDNAQLNAVILPPDGGFRLAAWDAFEPYRALDDQTEFDEGLHIRFGHNEADFVSSDGEQTQIVHRETGLALTVPSSSLYEADGRLWMREYTTYRPAVKRGDAVKLIGRGNGLSQIKKDGVVGWYAGRLEKL